MNYHETIEGILGPKGILAKSMPGYEYREQQVRMALEVFEAIESGDQLVIEAPTGTGKTLSYLIAAALSRKRVAISTGTKNLQEQLFYKDIPFVKERVFPQLKAALLKGRGNFVCHTRLLRYLRQPFLEGMSDTGTLQEIVRWYRRTRQKGQGDRAELENLPDDDPIWPEICSSSETCAGKRCTEKDECFVLKMRARASEADLMIVNHHLLCSDLALKESGFGEVIPRYEALIVDEAHGLEDAATQHFGFHLSQFRITRFARDTRSEIQETGIDSEKIQTVLSEVEDLARRLFASFSDIEGQRQRFESIGAQEAEARDILRKRLETLSAMLSNVPEASEELRAMAQRGLEISSELDIILGEETAGDYACWAERRDRSVVLHASPVDVGDKLRSRLYEKVPAVVFTSATLSSGGNFAYFKSRVGLDNGLEPSETILDSPFDYTRQTLLYIPRSLPEPNTPGFTDAVAPVLEQVLKRTNGRAFVLFTSYRNMDAVHKKMEGRVPFPLLIQGSKPKTRLLSEFRERTGSVLFATASFWEGVDVQGDALSCVIVDRLPFAPPNDPIVSSRVERLRKQGKDAFFTFQVPMAVISLKQGLGRLIRTRSDRGILCILDLRILTKRYGKVFRESLYGSPIRREPQDIESFFSNHSETSLQERNTYESPAHGGKRKSP